MHINESIDLFVSSIVEDVGPGLISTSPHNNKSKAKKINKINKIIKAI